MNLDDRLEKDSRNATARAGKGDPYYAEEPDWLIYKEREKKPWLNKDKGVFTETDKTSINRALSVFDASSTFDTGRKE